jgi:hypothetical protein
VGHFEFLRDVLGDSIDNGQFHSACITIILSLIIWRLSPVGLAQVLIRLIDFAERRNSIGYWMALISLMMTFSAWRPDHEYQGVFGVCCVAESLSLSVGCFPPVLCVAGPGSCFRVPDGVVSDGIVDGNVVVSRGDV